MALFIVGDTVRSKSQDLQGPVVRLKDAKVYIGIGPNTFELDETDVSMVAAKHVEGVIRHLKYTVEGQIQDLETKVENLTDRVEKLEH